MSEGWQKDDLALCVAEFVPSPRHANPHPAVKPGRIFTVDAVLNYRGVLALVLRDHPSDHPNGSHGAEGFRKIKPHEADEEDAETIKLMGGKPVREMA